MATKKHKRHRRKSVNQVRRWFLILIVLIAVAAAVVTIRLILPARLGGVRMIVPFLFFSQEADRFTSPDGRLVIVVYVNDAGAAHSGWFPTWIVQARWYGDKVVAKGYLKDSRGPVPLVWTGPHTFEIELMKGRYDNTPSLELVDLK